MREALGGRADDVEAVEVRSETTYAALHVGYRAEWCGDGPPGALPLAAPAAPPARLAG